MGGPHTETKPEAAGDRKQTLHELWDLFEGAMRGVQRGNERDAINALRRLLFKLDGAFRDQALKRNPDGPIRDAITAQLRASLIDQLRDLVRGGQLPTGKGVVDWFAGAAIVAHEFSRLATAIERVTAERQHEEIHSFAGNSSFIPIEAVVQLLVSAQHRGVLTLETESNRLDLFFDNQVIAFFSPMHFLRSVLAGEDLPMHRELPRGVLTRAERRLMESGKPIVVSLAQEGILETSEVCETGYLLGAEVFFDLLHRQSNVRFRYSKLQQLPESASRFRVDVPVAPLLIEARNREEDWLVVLKVFPDPDAPLRGIGDADEQRDAVLTPHERRILDAVRAGASPQQIGAAVGIPLHDIYRTLVRFARDRRIEPECAAEEFDELLELGLIGEAGPVAPSMADPDAPTDVAAAIDDAWQRIAGE
ncbi:MAG: DUF4388 domain-containing protein [Planctomycetes bacterium]|nr:DUF4388 domain-containing protein [Planctomycetota bacterium]MCB9870303.1 DUF4388 domain-containing protein [Planctomycetota bacterium]MCB9888117.1 DUF4388 domain-containing protein [Planctomycetota bacterium]